MAKKAEKKIKKKPGRKRTVSDEIRHPTDFISIRIDPPEKPDPEEVGYGDVDDTEDKDISEAFSKWDGGEKMHAHIVFPPPKNNPTFRRRWKFLIDTIASRPNFKAVHLFQLEVLCDLFVEYEQLSKWIRTHGYTYTAMGRQGKQHKTYPQVGERNQVKNQIRAYSRMLDLASPKGGSAAGPVKGGAEWE